MTVYLFPELDFALTLNHASTPVSDLLGHVAAARRREQRIIRCRNDFGWLLVGSPGLGVYNTRHGHYRAQTHQRRNEKAKAPHSDSFQRGLLASRSNKSTSKQRPASSVI
jgi:hypothetical protein